jgi:TPP-dependent pyruvate/acetoin dehydrogenase alpha subunit
MVNVTQIQPTAASEAPFEEAGYWMHLIRAVEDAGRRLYLQGRLPGSLYDGRGQEATAIGAALVMGRDDIACPLIRDMGVHLVRGVTPSEIFRHYLGKAGAPMNGRDGNIHLGAFERGTIPMISHLPEMLPVGMGVALARQRRGLSSVAFGFCGDGASCGGVFHETLNLAAVMRAPLVVILERNHYAYMTPENRYLPVAELSIRAAGYGIPAWSADGNDVLAVHTVVQEAAAMARAGEGPSLVEVFTYRMHGHGVHDAQKYVPKNELDLWRERDPLDRWRIAAAEKLGWTEADQQALEGRVAREIEDALADALDAPYPSPDDLRESLFA